VQPIEKTENILPLLHEIRHDVNLLLSSNQTSAIDLQAMPFAPSELSKLKGILGVGEVFAELHALGKTTFQETSFSGVWWITHFNTNQQLISQTIEICHVPALLMAQQADIQLGLQQLSLSILGGVSS